MLRDQDYKLAIKLGIMDEDEKEELYKASYKRLCTTMNSKEEYCDPVHYSETEICKLKDTIMWLMKELLAKDELLKQKEMNFTKCLEEKESISQYYRKALEDMKLLEEIIDKLEKRLMPSMNCGNL